MPYLPDGTPVDMILNPLGVPSRMNVGQVLETHLGWAAKELGNQVNAIMEREFSPQALKAKLKDIYKSTKAEKLIDKMDDDDVVIVAGRLRKGIPVQSPVFDGASEEEIKNMLAAAGLPEDGKTILFDGQTGEPFDQVTGRYVHVSSITS
jgi:DNA-directed RNA polymerase subunit beta